MLFSRIKRIIEEDKLISRGDIVIAAVSGGPDSICLLHLLSRLAPQAGFELVAAHLNHRMRPEAEQEEEAVRAVAGQWGVPFESESVDIRAYSRNKGVSEEVAGRVQRYRFLLAIAKKYGANKIALGHQLDDQAETVLFNLIRGTGLDGLAGILPDRAYGPVRLVRPLLTSTRSEIEIYCLNNDLKPSIDSSNLQTFYTRNRIRLELIPILEKQYNPKVKTALAGLAGLAALDRDYLQKETLKRFYKITSIDRSALLLPRKDLLAVHPALRGRLIKLALQKIVPPGRVTRLHVNKTLQMVQSGRTSLRIELPGRARVIAGRSMIIFSRREEAPAKTFSALPLSVPGETIIPSGGAIFAFIAKAANLKWPPAPKTAYLDLEAVYATGPLTVRPRWKGARFYPQGSPGSKKLKDFFIDKKIPPSLREKWPLVVAGSEIAWVAGIRIGELYKVKDSTEKALVLKFHPRGSP